MPRSADPPSRLPDQAGAPNHTGARDSLARLSSRLVELDLDAPTIELLLAALTADAATTTTEPALTTPPGADRHPA